ncbi:hypothetical protein [Ilumatobacter nonamiensis]|uniref:hypothetical protein n=1 Tax=Ilumatobacter nonamiensis TaxID=467093 RepID=UPI000346CC26|nr:hypothetical protein [Ilumatobacter nonamiensis]
MIRGCFAALSLVLVLAGCTASDDARTPDTTADSSSDPADDASAGSAPASVEGSDDGAPSDSAADGTGPEAEGVPPGAGLSLGALGDQVVEFETEDGSVQIGSGQVPEALAAFPVPDDLEVQLASTEADDAGFTGLSSATISELADFYVLGLPEAGYDVAERRDLSESAVIIDFEADSGLGQVAITTSPGGDSSTLVVTFGSDGSP